MPSRTWRPPSTPLHGFQSCPREQYKRPEKSFGLNIAPEMSGLLTRGQKTTNRRVVGLRNGDVRPRRGLRSFEYLPVAKVCGLSQVCSGRQPLFDRRQVSLSLSGVRVPASACAGRSSSAIAKRLLERLQILHRDDAWRSLGTSYSKRECMTNSREDCNQTEHCDDHEVTVVARVHFWLRAVNYRRASAGRSSYTHP